MKRDINLLPKRATSKSSSKGVIVALSVLLLYIIVFGVALKLPADLVNAAKEANIQLDNQIIALQPQVDEYERLVVELDELVAQLDSKEKVTYSDRTLYNSFDIIEKTCPTGVMILSYKNTNQAIELIAKAESDEQVAQFMLELDRSGEFAAIQFDGTGPSSITIYNEFGESIDHEAREFALTLIYDNTPDEEETTEEAGGGE